MLTYLGHFPRLVGFISGSTLQYLSSSLTGHIVGELAGLSQPLAVMLLRSLDPTRKWNRRLGAVLILMQFLTGKIDWFCWSLYIIFFSFHGFYVGPSGSEFEEETKCFKASIEFAHFTGTRQQCVGYIIWLCLFLTCADLSKGRMFELCESYPRNHTPNHTPKKHNYECFFWERLGLHWPH